MTSLKHELNRAIDASKHDFESELYLLPYVSGGDELLARNTILYYLNRNNKSGFKKEGEIEGTKKIADIFTADKKSVIDFGHNGTWQTQTTKTGLVNKVKSDIRKYIVEESIEEVYCVGILTDIIKIDPDFSYLVVNYRKNIINLTRTSATEKINFVKSELASLDKEFQNTLVHHKFKNLSKGFEVDIHFFLLGPFNKDVHLQTV